MVSLIPKHTKNPLRNDSERCKKYKITDNCSNCGYQRECDNFDIQEATYYDNRIC